MNAIQCVDILGANRAKFEIGPMIKALEFHSWGNTPEEAARLEAAKWARRNWSAYAEECNRRRDLRTRR